MDIEISINDNKKKSDELTWLRGVCERLNDKPLDESKINLYKELLGHTSQDIDTLED